MWNRQHEPRISPWVEDGFDEIVAEMAPEGWEPATDDEEAEEEAAVEDRTDGAGDPADVDDGATRSALDLDEEPEIARERALELLIDIYEAESDAEDVLDELLNRGWFYEVDGQLRVTEPEW